MILRLTDGTTTINLTGGTNSLYLSENYAPVAPDPEVAAVASQLRDGGDVTSVLLRNVSEAAVLAAVAATFATVQTAINAVEALLVQAAQRRNTGKGAAVYVEYRPGDSGTIYRSELLYGRLAVEAESASAAWIDTGAVRVVVAWTRRFYWEGSETELALDNGTTPSKTTGGVTVYNHDDSGHDNWVDIAGGDITGVLPSPLEVRMYNSYNVSPRTYRAAVAGNTFSTPATFSHILEGENASDIAGGAAATVDANSSNGYYQAASWAASTETKIMQWSLNAAYLAKTAGYNFRLLARVLAADSGLRVRPKIRFSLTTLWEGAEVAIGTPDLQDLGIVRLPPWLAGQTNLYDIDLALYGRRTGGAAVSIDFVQVTALDGYRYLEPRGYGAAYGTTLVDDGIEDLLYVDWGGIGLIGHYTGQGQRVHAWPGRALRLYFLVENDSGSVDIARTHTIRVYYRPRVLSV